jgi:hypothetical protein
MKDFYGLRRDKSSSSLLSGWDSSETSVSYLITALRQNPEVHNLNLYRRENLKACNSCDCI